MTVWVGLDDRQGGVLHPADADDLEFDEVNEAHLARRGISVTEVTQVWLDGPVYVPNKKVTGSWGVGFPRNLGGEAVRVVTGRCCWRQVCCPCVRPAP